MPAFLLVSGYLMNVRKRWQDFLRTIFTYAVPYLLMESAYIGMASVLPIREHLDSLSVGIFLDRLFVHPLGPYWYLQTLVVCGVIHAAISRFRHIKPVTRIIFTGIVFYLISHYLDILPFGCSMYFLAGTVLRSSGIPFTSIIQSSSIAIWAFLLLAVHPQNLRMETSGGILMVGLVMSAVLFAYDYIGHKSRQLMSYLGRKTMPLFLFSPAFTFICKPLVPVFVFDGTGLIYLFVSLSICISGSLAVEWILTKTGLSDYFYARQWRPCVIAKSLKHLFKKILKPKSFVTLPTKKE